MTPFQVPEGPYTIDKIMDSIREQVIAPSLAASAETPAASEPRANSPLPSPSAEPKFQNLRQSLTMLANALSSGTHYRVRSHRPIAGVFIDPIKRLIHWGSKPYTDLVRQRQDDWNALAVETLRQMFEIQADLRSMHAEIKSAQEKLDREIRARHDLGPFFSSIPREKRLQAMNETRGQYDDIHMRQKIYVDRFRGLPGRVLDVGCGRGELLNQLRLEGIEAWGADIDPLMIEMTQSKGVHAVLSDALSALRAVEPGTLGGVFAAQVVEHFFPGELLEFLMLARNQLAPGGKMILETLNPASLAVLAKSYCRDIDHKQPIHPEYMKLLVELAGFDNVELHYLHPFTPRERPAPLPAAESIGLKPEARAALQRRFDHLDALLYGMQDYFVVATAPGGARA